MGIIMNQAEIDKYNKVFRESLRTVFTQTTVTKVGHPQSSWRQTVWWSNELKMWMSYTDNGDVANKKYFTLFGLTKPLPNQNTPINAEINFPSLLSTRPNSVQGAFYKTDDNRTLIVHRGSINVGHGRIEQKYFMAMYAQYSGNTILTRPSTITPQKEYAIIGDLHSTNLPEQVLKYVTKIQKIKDEIRKQMDK